MITIKFKDIFLNKFPQTCYKNTSVLFLCLFYESGQTYLSPYPVNGRGPPFC
jgi:hypothetical protein